MATLTLNKFADRLAEILPEMMRGFARRQSNEIIKGTITLPQGIILELLYKHGAMNMTDLAHHMCVSTPAVTGFINRLVKTGYVRRIFDSKDRRVIIIQLKAKAEELVKRVYRERRQMTLEIFGKISMQDRENYLRILTKVKSILEKEKKSKA
jgi:DNA-binding MarR family transcriptional regulator